MIRNAFIHDREEVERALRYARQLGENPDNKELGLRYERAVANLFQHKVPEQTKLWAREAGMRDYDYPLPADCRIVECVVMDMPRELMS